MRKDLVDIVARFYKERLAYYKKLVDAGITKALEDEDIATIDRRIKEIKVLALRGETTPEIDAEYDRLVSDFRVRVRAYLPKIKYECPHCKDTGVVNGRYCSCFMNRYRHELREKLNIDTLPHYTFSSSSLDNYNLTIQDKARYEKVYDLMKKFADNYPNVPKANMCITGKSGSGKTFMVSALANRLIERNVAVQYITSFDLGELMLKCHLDYKDKSLDAITNADVLIIDDLGTEPIRNNVNKTYLQSILDSRIAHNKSTIITTNLNEEQLMSKYGERLMSRLLNKNDTYTIDFTCMPNLRTTK